MDLAPSRSHWRAQSGKLHVRFKLCIYVHSLFQSKIFHYYMFLYNLTLQVSTQFDERMEVLGRPFDGLLGGLASLRLHGSELNKARKDYLDMTREKFSRITSDYLNGSIKGL